MESNHEASPNHTAEGNPWLEPAPARTEEPPQYTLSQPHWFQYKAVQIHIGGDHSSRPQGVRQWVVCLWNADVFVNEVPFLKTVALASLVLSATIGWLCR